MDLIESIREAKLEELEAKILKCERDCKELWGQHLRIAEQAGQCLHEFNQLKCEIVKLKERKNRREPKGKKED